MDNEQQKECKIDLSSPFAFLLFLKMLADKEKKEKNTGKEKNMRISDKAL